MKKLDLMSGEILRKLIKDFQKNKTENLAHLYRR